MKVAYIIATTLTLGCSTATQSDRGNTNASTATTNSGAKPSGKGGTENSEPGKDDPSVATKFDGEKYFAANIDPVFTTMCETCHAPPRVTVPNPAPRTIFVYSAMLALLMDGPSSSDNKLVAKITNKVSHSGGNMCKSGMTGSPCKEIVAWADKETAKRNASNPSGGSGQLKDVTTLGVVSGWAMDQSNPSKKLEVKFFVGGPSETGTAAGTTQANVGGYVEGNHGFSHTLDLAHVTNTEKQIWAYAVQGDKLVMLAGSPFKYTAYKSSAAGTAYYEANVKPQFQASCSSCHGAPTLSGQFSNLINPPKHQGGTASNNKLVIKGSGGQGQGHDGGNPCGGANAGVCARFQTWWTMEFGG